MHGSNHKTSWGLPPPHKHTYLRSSSSGIWSVCSATIAASSYHQNHVSPHTKSPLPGKPRLRRCLWPHCSPNIGGADASVVRAEPRVVRVLHRANVAPPLNLINTRKYPRRQHWERCHLILYLSKSRPTLKVHMLHRWWVMLYAGNLTTIRAY